MGWIWGKARRGTLVLLFKQACVNLFKSDRHTDRTTPHRRRTQPQNGDDRGRRARDEAYRTGTQDAGRRTVGVSITYKSLLD